MTGATTRDAGSSHEERRSSGQGSLLVDAPVPLEIARAAYGHGASAWAHRDKTVERTWWLALSGALDSDYNQALLHGDDAGEVLPEVLARVDAVGQPSVVAFAGAGLASAQQIADEGWVCVGALPFMYRGPRPGIADTRVRCLAEADLAAARAVLTATFGISADAAASLFRPSLLARGNVRTWGLFDPALVSVAVTVEVGAGLYVGWALATAPGLQHRRYGSSLLRHIDDWYDRHGGLGSLHLATSAGARLYAARDHTTLEHWQLWSKPRWILGHG